MIRGLRLIDLDDEYFKLLSQLSGESRPLDWWEEGQRINDFWKDYLDNKYHSTFVYEDILSEEVVGTATIIIENKLLHYVSKVAHIEDVVVDKRYRSTGVGRALIDKCVNESIKRGCYKVILDCADNNIPFYERCGFKRHENCMRIDLC